MTYYTNLFSPETFEAFGRSGRDVSGFRLNQQSYADKLNPGDKFVCYMTQLSRWVGILEVQSMCFVDESPLFYPESDPFVVRFRIKPTVWLSKDRTVPIHEPVAWDQLSFTRDLKPGDASWTGILRRSLNRLRQEDGEYLESLMLAQASGGHEYPIAEDEFRRLVTKRIRRVDKTVTVTVPTEEGEEEGDCARSRCQHSGPRILLDPGAHRFARRADGLSDLAPQE